MTSCLYVSENFFFLLIQGGEDIYGTSVLVIANPMQDTFLPRTCKYTDDHWYDK